MQCGLESLKFLNDVESYYARLDGMFFRNNSGRALQAGEVVHFQDGGVVGIALDPAAKEPSRTTATFGNLGVSQRPWEAVRIAPLVKRPAKEVEKEYGLPEGSLNADDECYSINGWIEEGYGLLKGSLAGKRVRLTKACDEDWGDLPIGTIFAGGENGELLEVIESPLGIHCNRCYYHTTSRNEDMCRGRGILCARDDGRSDGVLVHFVKLERTNDE